VATVPAGQDFFYNTGALTLLSAIIRKATGHPLDEFARTTLFEPLGITGVEWVRVKGDTDAGGGLRLRPRDMAKIGLSLRAAAGTTVRSFRRHGSTPR
jgi:CubicO group peptidase (beta-lactamase class C family)